MNIGITTRFNYGFFSNGLYQNIIILYEILERAGHTPTFIDFCDNEFPMTKNTSDLKFLKDKRIKNVDELKKGVDSFDVVCAPGIACNTDHKVLYKHLNKNCKIVAITYGNNLITETCDYICKEKSGTFWDEEPEEPIYDACFLSPHYKFQEQFLKTSCSENTKILPYLWDAKFIIELSELNNYDNLTYKPEGKLNLAVVEPNLNISKNYIIPLWSVKEIIKKSPDSFKKFLFFGTNVFDDNKKVIQNRILRDSVFKKNTDKLAFDPRQTMAKIMNDDNPLFLSHQHLNSLNYVYLEALYLGYPLVHNSEDIKDFGYYYEGFNNIDAADQCIVASEIHNDNLSLYKDRGNDAVWRFSPHNPLNIKKTSELFENI